MSKPLATESRKRRKPSAVFFLSLLLFTMPLPTAAQRVSQQQAYEKAMAFLGKNNNTGASRKTPRKTPALQLAGNGDRLFIFNDEANGGYVIVSGDERMPEVLGYSDTGKIDPDHLPCNLKMILDDCTRKVDELRANPHAKKIVSHHAAQQTAVAPLLGATAWHQDWPYNLMCPEIDGRHCPTGCTATAAAQIMYYHKWPTKGQGSHSYEWNGQELSADFSQSTYKWSKMTPTYQSNSSKESINAVALLMRDVGYACDTNYGLTGSGGAGQGKALITYFDYDASMGYLEGNYCSKETINDIIIDEITHSRPVFFAGSSNIVGAHAMVIDGMDSNGYFHFNFGVWGDENGYYTLETVQFNHYPSLNFGIKKDEGGSQRVLFGTSHDFAYEPQYNRLNCSEIRVMSALPVENVQTALAIENTKTHKIIYADEGDKYVFYPPDDLSDGNYILYPVARFSGSNEWQKLLFREYRQQYVDLNVKDGEYTYSNNHIEDFIQEGAVDVNGIVYFLDETTHTASVTFRNDRYDFYKGDITIPGTFTYQGQQYTVKEIGSNAFQGSNIDVLKIPKTVESLAFASFTSAKIGTILFEKGSQLKSVGGWAFNGARFNSLGIDLPEGTEELSRSSFQSCFLTRISLPSTINGMSWPIFNYTYQFKVVMANWQTPLAVTYGDHNSTFNGFDISLLWLFVPKGTATKYRQADTWKKFGHIVEMSDTVTTNGLKYVLSDTDGSAYLLTQTDWNKAEVSIPRAVSHQGKAYTVKNITPYAFANTAIQELTIPSSVNYIGEGAFYCFQCPIETIKFHGKTPPKVSDTTDEGKEGFNPLMFASTAYNYVTLYVPTGSKSKYKADSFWGRFANIVEDPNLGEESIPGDANNDGFLNIGDATVIINYILNKHPEGFVFDNADINGDGFINMNDVTSIINIILNNNK